MHGDKARRATCGERSCCHPHYYYHCWRLVRRRTTSWTRRSGQRTRTSPYTAGTAGNRTPGMKPFTWGYDRWLREAAQADSMLPGGRGVEQRQLRDSPARHTALLSSPVYIERLVINKWHPAPQSCGGTLQVFHKSRAPARHTPLCQ